jgi:hypothetical protein
MFRGLAEFPDYEIRRDGLVRRQVDGAPVGHNIQRQSSETVYVRLRKGNKYCCRCVNVLLRETFGPGAATAAGFPEPDMKRVAVQRKLAKRPRRGKSLGSDANPNRLRYCHDCGKPTSNWRCEDCWRKLRGFGFFESSDWLESYE